MATEITAAMVKQLREMTGAGMMDSKAALIESNGDFDLAIEVLRKKGLKDIGKRAGKVAAEGTIGVYSHSGDRIVSVVELNCETDFVAKGDGFKKAAKEIAMHVAAMNPRWLSVEDVPQDVIEKEKEILMEQLPENQKAKAEMIIPGKMAKFYSENVLLDQLFIKDESGKQTVKNVVDELSMKTGEKVVLRRFARFEVGEGIEKKSANFADEVAEMIK